MKTIVTQIPDYHTFLKGKKTLEIGYPWLTFGAIMALEKILRDSRGSFDVLELGSGGSTLFFSERCRSVWSIEDDPEWAEMVNDRLVRNNVNITCARKNKLIRKIQAAPNESFDLILVDSCSGGETYLHRKRMYDAALPKLKVGGWLVVDNYGRMKIDYSGFDVYTFDMLRYSGRGTRLCKNIS